MQPSAYSNWLNEIPDDIVEIFREGDPPVVFIGSGFGKEAIPPLKTGGELARHLRTELRLKDNQDNLSELLQYLQNTRAETKRSVTDWLKKNLNHGVSKPGGAHRLLLELPCKIFFTTNYDSILTDASRDMHYDLKAIDDPASYESNLGDVLNRPRSGLLARFHGSFEFQHSIIATTDDYIERFTADDDRWRKILEDIFTKRRVVFMGYSLKDFTTWTSFISVITKWKDAVFPHVMVSPSKSQYTSQFWNRYNIRYIPLKAHQFLIALHDRLGTFGQEAIATAAVSACYQLPFEEGRTLIENERRHDSYPSHGIAAMKLIMDGRYEDR